MAVASPDKDFFQVTCLSRQSLPDPCCWLPLNLSASGATVCVAICPAVCAGHQYCTPLALCSRCAPASSGRGWPTTHPATFCPSLTHCLPAVSHAAAAPRHHPAAAAQEAGTWGAGQQVCAGALLNC